MHSPFELLIGTILSFADSISDIVTLVEFYREDHKTWFYLGLAFVILPCLVFPILYLVVWNERLSRYSGTRKCEQTLLWGFHPFSAAFVRLRGFVYCLRIWWRGVEIDLDSEAEYAIAHKHIDLVVLLESALESAPQFLLQLYAMMFQDGEVGVIVIFSVTVSYLSLVWTFAMADEMLYEKVLGIGELTLARRACFVGSHLFQMGCRLTVILFFTMKYKWWILVVLLFHTFVIMTAEIILFCPKNNCKLNASMVFISFLYCCLHWLRDYLPLQYIVKDDPSQIQDTILAQMQALSNVLFIVENTGMALAAFIGNSGITVPVGLGVYFFQVLMGIFWNKNIFWNIFRLFCSWEQNSRNGNPSIPE